MQRRHRCLWNTPAGMSDGHLDTIPKSLWHQPKARGGTYGEAGDAHVTVWHSLLSPKGHRQMLSVLKYSLLIGSWRLSKANRSGDDCYREDNSLLTKRGMPAMPCRAARRAPGSVGRQREAERTVGMGFGVVSMERTCEQGQHA